MSEILKIGNEHIRKEELDIISDEILQVLKKQKRTYQFDKSVLNYCIEKLNIKANSTIFQ